MTILITISKSLFRLFDDKLKVLPLVFRALVVEQNSFKYFRSGGVVTRLQALFARLEYFQITVIIFVKSLQTFLNEKQLLPCLVVLLHLVSYL